MIVPFLYLFLAHLVADFLLQPAKLISWKHRSWEGVLIHVLIHFALSLIFIFPYLPNNFIIITVGIIAFLHFFIDIAKIILEEKTKKYVLLFFLDQVIHIIVLLVSAYFLRLEFSNTLVTQTFVENFPYFTAVYSNPFVIFGLCTLIIATYVYEISAYEFSIQKHGQKKFKPDCKKMLKRAFIAFLIYSFVLAFALSF